MEFDVLVYKNFQCITYIITATLDNNIWEMQRIIICRRMETHWGNVIKI